MKSIYEMTYTEIVTEMEEIEQRKFQRMKDLRWDNPSTDMFPSMDPYDHDYICYEQIESWRRLFLPQKDVDRWASLFGESQTRSAEKQALARQKCVEKRSQRMQRKTALTA